MNRSQARSQVVTVWGYLTPMSDSEKSVRACQAASWFGAVQIGLESGRDLPAVPVGDEPHPGARNRVDHTGGDRGLGPGLPAFASGRPVSPSHSPARFAPVGEVPPSTISTSLTPLWLCRHGRTRAALQGGSLPGAGAQILKPIAHFSIPPAHQAW